MTDHHKYPPPPSPESLGLAVPIGKLSGKDLPKMGKFRFQLLADWVAREFAPCRVADVGGGKGLLAYLLQQRGFDAVVVDPVYQDLPPKYTDVHLKRRIKLTPETSVPHLDQPFTEDMCADFDLVIGLHAHGSNLHIIRGTARYGKNFLLLPCCVIEEPEVPPKGANWFSWLAGVAAEAGHEVQYFQLNFKGQNLGMYGRTTGERG